VNLARAHLVLREYPAALAAVERALEFAPDDLEALRMRELLAREQGSGARGQGSGR
jgi:uncharacterized protein HemY